MVYIPKSDINISRAQMPQISSKDVPTFLQQLKKEGIAFRKKQLPVGILKPSQGEFNPDKIKKMMKDWQAVKDKPLLVSRDFYIIDGHHRYAGQLNDDPKSKITVIQVQLNVLDLIKKMHDFELSFTKQIHESTK